MKNIRSLLIAFSFILWALGLKAQIEVTTPMTSTPAPGQYFSYSSITLGPGFSFAASGTNSLKLYIANPDCQPLANSFSQNQNYIATSTPLTAMKAFSTAGWTSCDMMQIVQYFDGLGRPLQTIEVKGTTANKDIVQPFVYDQFGRETQKYLPYPAQGTADGSYKGTVIDDQGAFYNSPPGTSGVSQITDAYSITNFEPSPLNRMLEEGAPGAVWQPVVNSASGHTNKVDYMTNNNIALGDANSYLAAFYTVTINSDQSRTLNRATGTNGYYAADQLYVTVSKDENWVSGKIGTTEEYVDKKGRLILKRTFNQVGTTVQVLSTYYVYDDMGNLVFVLPPNSYADNSTPDQNMRDNVCYQFQYDERNRLVQKKLPGKGWEYMVYNLLDQVIFSQDANQRDQTSQVWSFTKYDVMGRVIMTGTEGGHTESRIDLQNYVTSTLKNTSSGFTEWETPLATGTHGYTNTALPTGQGIMALTVSYYDDYNNIPGLPTGYQVTNGISTMTKGLLTASKSAVLNNPSDYLWAVHYYDDLGREVRSYQQHYLGGTANAANFDVVLTAYNFNNQDTSTNRRHFTSALIGTPKLTINNTYRYDHMGRKVQTFEQINGGPNVLLSQTDYNEIGQVQTKHLHSTTGSAPFLQNINYTYNERGWLKNSDNALFAMQLTYNNGANGNSAPFNGNISNQTWQIHRGANKSYNYSHDALNRLTAGISGEGYHEKDIAYDPVGNITDLTRQNSVYKYTYTGNQLQSVSGLTTGTYQYDPNGNVKFDARTQKKIAYNLLNLPQSITATGFNLNYTYDATGQKLRKNNGATTTDYIGGIQYENGNIIFIQTEEGRAINSGGDYLYEYSLSDHLGNNRLSFDQNSATTIRQQDDYYPFGMEIPKGTVASPKNEYLYNKKELQEELGQYDYGARFYDPVIARWASVDPLASSNSSESAYSYAGNSPISFIDAEGLYKLPANFKKYPALTKMIKVYLQELKYNSNIRNSFKYVTDYTDKEFDDMVTFGKGPTIMVTEPDKIDPNDMNNPLYKTGSRFDRHYPNNLYIQGGVIDELEKELRSALKTHNASKLKFLMFKVSAMILHESVHRGNTLKHSDWESRDRNDQGAVWEARAFGQQFTYRADFGRGTSNAFSDQIALDYLTNTDMYMLYGLTIVGPGDMDRYIFTHEGDPIHAPDLGPPIPPPDPGRPDNPVNY